MVTPNGTLPISAFSELPQPRTGNNANEPYGWFYCLPRYRQGLTTPMSNPILKEELPIVGPQENSREAVVVPNDPASGCAQKGFLVFDQTGDRTTMIFSSGIGAAPMHQCPTSWNPKLPTAYNMIGNDDSGHKREPLYFSGEILTDGFIENHGGSEVGSEMHEDTEELNALLYSDDDSDYTEDDEVTSTGHSPSTMTDHDNQDWYEDGSAEEVADSDEATTKPNVFEEGYNVANSDSANSAKRKRSPPSEYEDDAQSSCANERYPSCSDDTEITSGNKRTRIERIRETVSILQRIVPGGKGKGATAVLDEAIHYLKSLKMKAEALGLD